MLKHAAAKASDEEKSMLNPDGNDAQSVDGLDDDAECADGESRDDVPTISLIADDDVPKWQLQP